ncbi:MAG: OmpA family protein [Treponema sp.]|jgi:outer membrane protein OmpA-like peptidoglycan-associated protein|nr:OmpA family protein [Treponema sp.]
MIRKICLFLLIIFIPYIIQAERFEFIHTPGSRYRILSVVDEAVDIDGRLSHRAEILNRIAVEVVDVVDGKGQMKATFQTSERTVFDMRNSNQAASVGFQWSREYDSEFLRDRLGYLTIDPKYFMPTVRNVPVFPDKDLQLLERWAGEGHEMHDFRDTFGIAEPYRMPFIANYIYIGEREWKGQMYPAFSVEYRIASRPPAVRGMVYPVRISGEFYQIVYWNKAMGLYIASEERFDVTFEMSNRVRVRYRGTAQSEVIESEIMNRQQVASEIANQIETLGIPDVNVRIVEEGVSISLEDIGFYPDSAVMLPGEETKLAQIADILKRYPDRDIVVSGHTALAGTAEGRMNLSTERARAVADYLLNNNVRGADRIVIRGYGAEKPIADNRTQEGMRRNRRVEITILEN